MEQVIRICEITGRMTVVAESLTTQEAMDLVAKKSREDEFGSYRRVAKSF